MLAGGLFQAEVWPPASMLLHKIKMMLQDLGARCIEVQLLISSLFRPARARLFYLIEFLKQLLIHPLPQYRFLLLK